jgi:hypothetical protein
VHSPWHTTALSLVSHHGTVSCAHKRTVSYSRIPIRWDFTFSFSFSLFDVLFSLFSLLYREFLLHTRTPETHLESPETRVETPHEFLGSLVTL